MNPTNKQKENKQLFTDEEYMRLLVIACGEHGATEEQMRRFIKVCEEMKMHALMLQAILAGLVIVEDYDGNEPLFTQAKSHKSHKSQN